MLGTYVESLARLEEDTTIQLTEKRSKEELRIFSDGSEQARLINIGIVRNPSQPRSDKLLCARYAHELDGRIGFFEGDINSWGAGDDGGTRGGSIHISKDRDQRIFSLLPNFWVEISSSFASEISQLKL